MENVPIFVHYAAPAPRAGHHDPLRDLARQLHDRALRQGSAVIRAELPSTTSRPASSTARSSTASSRASSSRAAASPRTCSRRRRAHRSATRPTTASRTAAARCRWRAPTIRTARPRSSSSTWSTTPFSTRAAAARATRYSARVTEGMSVIDEIAASKTGRKSGHDDVPLEPVVVQRATVVDHVRLSAAPTDSHGEAATRRWRTACCAAWRSCSSAGSRPWLQRSSLCAGSILRPAPSCCATGAGDRDPASRATSSTTNGATATPSRRTPPSP